MNPVKSAVATAVVLGLSPLFAVCAHAQQDYPTRPIRIIYPFAAGSGNDNVARLIRKIANDAVFKKSERGHDRCQRGPQLM